MVKMAPTDVSCTRRPTACSSKKTIGLSEVALAITQGLPAAFKLGENHLPCELPIRVNLIIGTFMQLFCMAMAWSSAHAGLLPVVMHVCKSMEAVAGS